MEESTAVDASDSGRMPLGSVPLFVYDHRMPPNNQQTAFAIGDGSLHTQVVPEFANSYDYHVTSHGWVLLVAPGPSPQTRLWDPRSGKSVSLPAMDHKPPANWKCYLSDVPTAPSLIVLVLNMDKPNFLYCRVGDDRWSAHEYDIGEVPVPPEFTTTQRIVIQQMVAVGGKFFFHEKGELGIIDFSLPTTPEFSSMDYPHVDYPDGSNSYTEFLLESKGELFSVNIFFKGFNPAEILTVEVYKMDISGPAPSLSKVDDLGDRVFLLSYPNTQSLCSASMYGLKGGHVYFNHNVTEELNGGPICIFDLDDQSLETLCPCQEMAELMSSPFWMIPTDPETCVIPANKIIKEGDTGE